MSREHYTFANLQPEAVEEIRAAEKRLSAKCGEAITLIAYRSNEKPVATEDTDREWKLL
jgi:hypothetical protein